MMNGLLHAKERTGFRNSDLTDLRKLGNIPAVVYGANFDSKAVYISEAELQKTMREVGRNGVISLDINGAQHNVVVNQYQTDPLKRSIVHIDFLAVDMTKEISAQVRLVLVGEAAGVKDGGVLQQPVHELSVTATPADIPPLIEVDVTNLQVGETLTIADIWGYEGLKISHDAEEVIASILPPKQEEEIHSGEQQEQGHPDNEEGRETTPES